MFSSTEIRRRGLTDFLTSYEQCCVLHNSIPLKIVTSSFCNNCLSIDASKVRVSDWTPFLRAVSNAKKLQKLRITSTWRSSRPTPIIHQDKSIIPSQIAEALKTLLSKKNDLKEVAIENIQLTVSTMSNLAFALEKDFCNLRVLSLNSSKMGDLGLSKIQKYLKNTETIERLDLSGCDLSPVATTIVIDMLKTRMLKGTGYFWTENLRKNFDELDEKWHGVRVLKLSDNSRIGNSVIALLGAIIYDDIRCLERLELRKCSITSSAEFDACLEDMLERMPTSLAVLDFRQNPIMENDSSRSLVQLLMSKLISLHPKIEYEKLRSSPRRSSSQLRRAVSTRHLSPRQDKVSKALSLNALNEAVEMLPEVVPVGATGFVPWRTAEKMAERKIKNTSRKFGVGSTETRDSSSDFESAIDTEYRDLPGSKSPSPKKSEKQFSRTSSAKLIKETDSDLVCQNHELVQCLKRERLLRQQEEEKRQNIEIKYSQLSSRISSLENVIQKKDLQIQSLSKEKEGHVLVEENLLRNIEESFSKFQGFLGLLNELNLPELTSLPEYKELRSLADFSG